jgi:putative hydrolase of the HAD superfamily
MANLKNKKHVFFDFDDTLWDFQKNSAVVLSTLFTEFALEKKLNADFDNFLSTYVKVNKMLWARYERKELDKGFLRNNRLNETFRVFGYDNYEENLRITNLYLEKAPHGICLKDGCLEILDYLKNRYKLHIITNGFKETQFIKIDACGLRHYFTNIIICEEHGTAKPEEKVFRLAENLAGANRNECIMVGDSFESDIQGALNAGWEAIYFSDQAHDLYAGNTINRLEQLKSLL